MQERLTYKSCMGDYGSAVDWEDDRQEIYALRNKLGKYEDNDWRSIAKFGNPEIETEYGYFLVTIEDTNTRERIALTDIYYRDSLYGFYTNTMPHTKAIAWKNLPEPYDGD